MCMTQRLATALVALWLFSGREVVAQDAVRTTERISEDLQPHIVGSKGMTAIGFGGYADRVYSSERLLPVNYTIQINVHRFMTNRFAVRGGLSGSGSAGGDDPEDRPTGVGAPALHASGGLFYYLTPQSMWSPYAGAEYWTPLTQRADADRGAVIGSLGLEGAVSRRLGIFLEGGYGLGLTGPDEQTTRLVARVGMRWKF
jgi:hypothetical protein